MALILDWTALGVWFVQNSMRIGQHSATFNVSLSVSLGLCLLL